MYYYLQLTELGHRGENKNAKTSKPQQKGFEPRGQYYEEKHKLNSKQISDSAC